MTLVDRIGRAGLVVLVGALALAGCSSSDTPSTPTASDSAATPTEPALAGELTIFAAASLEPTFDEIAAAFTAAYPDVTVDAISYDGSSTLATQLVEGAQADVFASADTKNMQPVVDAGLVDGAPAVFTTNTLQIVVPAGNPDGISSLADLAALSKAGGKVVVCAPEVPCGAATTKVTAAAGVDLAPASQEQNVTAVLTKVTAGEADAGLVYRTDVIKAGDTVEGVDFAEASGVVNTYPIAALTGAALPNGHDPAVARAFVAFVLSPDGQALLTKRGFVSP